MAYDISNAIMDYLVDNFLDPMNEGLLSDDPDLLKTIEKGPLQDDPTLRASYLIVEPDFEADPLGPRQPVGQDRKNKLKHVETAPNAEIGGNFLMVNYFKIGGWTPRALTKPLAYEQAGKYTRRLERAIQKLARTDFFYGIATDDGSETTGGLLQVFNLNGTVCKLIGGENEWYGQSFVRFAIYSQVLNDYWR